MARQMRLACKLFLTVSCSYKFKVWLLAPVFYTPLKHWLDKVIDNADVGAVPSDPPHGIMGTQLAAILEVLEPSAHRLRREVVTDAELAS